ncbi:Stp1/IreP family PP2C-type Ser/Thr phosphatase [Clostridium sp. AM58-1XD]|uniref:Stp1/IreP family PP2C-type Ser/Thr phosphatase n=1 Tax=Clostridium sp. AM58-1XD TaxID=2292307 RepID=UPI000E4DCABE|nr:Stp1/IreP family PP2C-type Ser/Thr phosphatase [Clostridium sp. AM58-1XD]RGY99427.1 Stp1/IreP family PP2C-type Ser/Thr phosphatase [Clostridium sp. AM58-1XD]
MKACAMTDVGKVRKINQDYIFSSPEPVGKLKNLYIVADGMGGHKAGDYASRFLVENLVNYVKEAEGENEITILKEGIRTVNGKLYQEALKNEDLSGMGTTLVAASIEGSNLNVANVGDSRMYLIRDGRANQITRDHSYVEEMVLLGRMKRGSEDYQRKKNIITRAVGTQAHVEADFFEITLEEHDCLLMCSDGLTNMLDDSEIEQIVSSDRSLKEKTEKLIGTANEKGGRDNIAVILIEPRISEVNIC